MENFLNKTVIKDSLLKLNNKDLSNEILEWIKINQEIINIFDSEDELSKNKIGVSDEMIKFINAKLRSKIVEQKKLTDQILPILKVDAKASGIKYRLKENVETLTSIYILNHVDELISPKAPENIKKTFSLIVNKMVMYYGNISELKLSVVLRTLKILNNYIDNDQIEYAERLINFSRESLTCGVVSSESVFCPEYSMIYNIYYGLFDGEPVFDDNQVYKNDEKVNKALLEDNSVLPESIIKELVESKKLSKYEAGEINFIINQFFYRMYIDISNNKEAFKNLFEGDLSLDKPAKFKDISILLNKYHKDLCELPSQNSDFDSYLDNVIKGNIKLPNERSIYSDANGIGGDNIGSI